MCSWWHGLILRSKGFHSHVTLEINESAYIELISHSFIHKYTLHKSFVYILVYAVLFCMNTSASKKDILTRNILEFNVQINNLGISLGLWAAVLCWLLGCLAAILCHCVNVTICNCCDYSNYFILLLVRLNRGLEFLGLLEAPLYMHIAGMELYLTPVDHRIPFEQRTYVYSVLLCGNIIYSCWSNIVKKT